MDPWIRLAVPLQRVAEGLRRENPDPFPRHFGLLSPPAGRAVPTPDPEPPPDSCPAPESGHAPTRVRTADFDYHLPPELIAQSPAPERDGSRLLHLDRASGRFHHRRFPDLAGQLAPGDLLVFNNSKVIPARLRGVKADTGGAFEILLLQENHPLDWWVLLKPGRRVRPGSILRFLRPDGTPAGLTARVREKNPEGHCRLEFEGTADLLATAEEIGEVPLPPYIERKEGEKPEDRRRYQTVYAQNPGSVAAPTAGLHFCERTFKSLEARGIDIQFVTLHVGAGTFLPVKVDDPAQHVMHEEQGELSPAAADAIRRTREAGGRVIAVGTTTVRVLETAARDAGGAERIGPWRGSTRLFLHPPADFHVTQGLITNFHLPQSTLLMLISAFARPGRTDGRDLIREAYAEAVRERYRFFSYGDAMLIL